MANRENVAVRELHYSAWHRMESLSRFFIHDTTASLVTCIDVDFLEYCMFCRAPLALIETTEGSKNRTKNTSVMVELARHSKIPAFLVIYELTDKQIESSKSNGELFKTKDILRFWVEERTSQDPKRTEMMPKEFAAFLLRLHANCKCEGPSKVKNLRHELI